MARRAGIPAIQLLAAAALAATACSGSRPVAPGPVEKIRVLMLTATAGFRHDSIPTARQIMTSLAAKHGDFVVTATEDLASITTAGLAGYDIVFFALTSGELAFTSDQRAALVAFVSGGKGFLGAHSATDTLYNWPEYGQIVGAYFKEHPWTEQATVIVEDQTHPATAGLGDRFAITEEFYTFRQNPRPLVQVLLRLDAESVGASGDYPLGWAHTFGQGRAYYNALGHFAHTWNDTRFQQQLVGAIRWAARR
jgi:type 1 glutamine amidotransferase